MGGYPIWCALFINNRKMRDQIPWGAIQRLANEEADEKDKKLLEDWLALDEKNSEILEELMVVDNISQISTEKEIHPDKTKSWSKIEQRIKSSNHKPFFTPNKYRYAAAAAILLFVVNVFLIAQYLTDANNLSNQHTQIVSPPGQKSKVVLPDSSVVWLNSGTTLTWPKNFNKKQREVTLTGEGFFEIRKDKSKTFRVNTGILSVEVLGTQFNVKCYPDDGFQEVTVSEGKVGLSVYGKELRQLEKNDQAYYDLSTNKISYRKESPDIVSSWKNNELIFEDKPIEDIIKYLERWYGVNIEADDEILDGQRYTFTVKTESFREMLEILKVLIPFDYEINGKEIKLNSSN